MNATTPAGLGETFLDAEVAQLYRFRPPYPSGVFARLRQLYVGHGPILDAGAGTGALARAMAAWSDRVDAVDPSSAMVNAGRSLPGRDDPRIRWLVGDVERTPLDGLYGLITCGASLHWMDLDVVLQRFRELLAFNAVLAIVDTEYVHGDLRDEIRSVIREYSELKHHIDTKDLVAKLRDSGALDVRGEERTEAVPFEQSVDDYIEMLHSTSTLARVRLGDRADAFDRQIRSVFMRRATDVLRYGVIGYVAWGTPRS